MDFEFLLSFEVNHPIQKKQMQQHVCTIMYLCFMVVFNLIKIITSLYLNAHKMHN
jgi:hypothetical protein